MPFDGDAAAKLAALRHRLGRAHLAQIVHQRRVIILVEGSEGSGKRALVKALGSAFDPTHFAVTAIAPDRNRGDEGHWLARFWARLPKAGYSAIFYHSWYRRVLEDKVLGLVTDKEWSRSFDEINEFESQQRDYGTLLIKLYLHITDDIQQSRIAERQEDQWQRHLLGPEELREPPARTAYRAAVVETLAQTDTRWAPWSVIDANDDDAALIAALTVVVEALEKAIPHDPPQRAEPESFMLPPEEFQPAG